MNSSVTITYDSSDPNARLAINFIKTLDCLKVTKNTPKKTKKCGLDEALEDVRAGRVTEYESVDDFFKKHGLDV